MVCVVEGLIGAGKTNLSRELAAALGAGSLVLLEPDEKGDANPYLADFYGSPGRWAFSMQVHLLQARYRMHLHAQWHSMQGLGHAVLDRSYFGDTAFARLQVRTGAMTTREFGTYQSIYHAMTASVLLPNVLVRLHVRPETARDRIANRMLLETGRVCENAIDLQYLRDLDAEITHMADVLRDQGVRVIDVPWEDDRPSAADRAPVVGELARQITGYAPPDPFLDLHRRTA